jgi:adenosine kinase
MTALICGSMAYDSIMVFHDRFANHILPDKIHILNVSFFVPTLRREFGGCAGNIAYNLKLLGGEGLPMATVGEDFAPYQLWLDRCGIDSRHLKVCPGSYTAQAYITTDLDDNQITAFHPGAMIHSHENKVPTSGISMGIVAPDGREGMLQHAEQFAAHGIPFIFDPGQGLPMFNGPELLQFIEQATYLTVNDYECQLLQERTGLSMEALAQRVKAMIVTLGGEGSVILAGGKQYQIPIVPAEKVVDPTGCGDAFRSGLLYGLNNGFDWETTGRLASLMGSLNVAQAGTQNHRATPASIADDFYRVFGYRY